MAKKIYKLEIEPLTGVHIGTGEALTPLDYIVQNTKSGSDIYMKFSSDAILNELISKHENLAEFYTASDRNDMTGVMEFFQKHISNAAIEYPCNVTPGFWENYRKNKNNDPIENAREVLQMYRPSGSKKPVIPGGSLKGAIRTAVLDDVLTRTYSDQNDFYRRKDEFEEARNYKHYEGKMQKELLAYNDAKNDPFRTLLIADAEFPAENTQLVGMLQNISLANASTGINRSSSMQIQAEIIRGSLIGGQAKTATTVTIDEALQKAKIKNDRKSFSFGKNTTKIISMKEIAGACNYFFINNFKEEYEKFYKNANGHVEIISQLHAALHAAINEKNTFIVRVGRWSQVEFMTFQEAFRKPKVPNRGGRSQGYGNSRTVFDYDGEYVPLGWCKCTYTLCE